MNVYIIFCNIAFAFLLHDVNCLSTAKQENDISECGPDGCKDLCPPDSVLGPDDKCQCSSDRCPVNPVSCQEGYVKKRIREGTDRPGECCSLEECVQETNKNCSAVTCPTVEPCPSDSYRLPAIKSLDGCCAVDQGCHCLPNCPQNCSEGMTPSIEVPGTGLPGRCCPLYTCQKTVIRVEPETTDDPPPEEAAICNTEEYGAVKHGFSWTAEGSCKTCVCQNGQLVCSTPACKPCIKSIIVPNECCPRCLIPIVQASHCPPTPNCTEVCSYGNELDATGCITCKCRDKCPRECTHDDGRCECDQLLCPPLLDCNLNCTQFGYQKEFGCDVCKCEECSKECSFGYKTDEKGSSICKCKPWPLTNSKNPETIERDTSCKTDENVVRDDGEMWFDRCRQCTCISGKEMCSLVHCSPLTCRNPVLNETSSCCPFCADDPVKNEEMSHMVCSGPNGAVMQEGETFILDKCIQCICHNGRALCRSKECPPTPCSRPRRPAKGECCATCLASNDIETELNAYFVKDNRCDQPHQNNTTWRKDACTSCRCVDNEARCYTELCETLNKCKRSLTVKGRCCPMCIDEAEKNTRGELCVFENTTYKPGDEWTLDSCTRCECLAGHTECTKKVCSQSCINAVYEPGECCPTCPDDPEFSLVQQTAYVILLLVVILVSIVVVVCVTKHWRYRKQQINMRDFGCPPPQYQYKYIPNSPYDTATSQTKVSSEKASLAPV